MTPLPITVIIPCYNMANTLARAVESAINANASWVIVVNDGSTDNCWQVAHRLRELHSDRVMYIENTVRLGVCASRNLAIQKSETGLIVPLDADDQLTPQSLMVLSEGYTSNTWVYGNWIENGDTVIAPPPGMLDRKNVCHATMLFATGDWIAANGYDPDFNIGGEDWAFQLALTRAGVTPVKVNEPIYIRDVSVNARTHKARDRIPMINQLVKEKYGNV